jgi:V/A-type H+-transporting ATPase subunit I
MFFPQAMTEIELIVPEKDLLPVTRVLTGQGVFHQVDASYLSSHTGSDSLDSWKDRAASYTALERQIVVIMQTLGIEEGSPPLDEQPAMLEVENVRPLIGQIEQDVREANSQVDGNRKTLEQLQNYIRQLEPIADVDLDVGMLRSPRYIHSTLGTMPAGHLERLQTSLSRIPHVLVPLREDSQDVIVWLTGAQSNADILNRAARSAYLDPLDLTDLQQGTPSEIIKSMRAAIESTRDHIEKQTTKIRQLHATYGQQLQTLLWRVRTSRMLADAMANFGKLHYTYLIVGWVPSARLEVLTQQLKQASRNILIDVTPFKRGEAQSQNVPVSLQNPGILGSFQQLVTTYARPRYEEIDPTLLITLTFPLLFGAMFGDVGHGLVLALLGGLLASRRVSALRGMASLGTVIATCGLAAVLFGFLYGSIFGLEDILPALWIQPMDNITQILGIAVGAGVLLLSLGFLLNIQNALMARDWGRFIFDHHGLAGLALYWSLLGLGAGLIVKDLPIPVPAFALLAALAGLAVMFSEPLKHLVDGHRPLIEGGFGMYLIQAAVELFENLISFLSNSLSYVRVGAFAVAHGGLSAVIFILADMVSPDHGPGYWIVVVFGNLFIVGFEGLIVGIQTMRLEYYEFFSKFFTGGGTPYTPLTPLRVADK